MSDFFFNAHALWQYVALVAVVVALAVTFRGAAMDRAAETIYRITAAVVGLQVLLGIGVWITRSGWSLGLIQGWVHPVVGIASVAILNVFIGRARKGEPDSSNRTVRIGVIIAIVLVVAAIAIGMAT